MKRNELIQQIKSADPFYESIAYDTLTNDDLIVIKLSIDANDKLMRGLVAKRTLEFEKQKNSILVTRSK